MAELKIVSIIIGLDVGGAEKMLSRLAERYHEDDLIDHTIITLTDLGAFGRQLRRNGIRIYTVGLGNFFLLPFHFVKLIILIKKLRPQLVQTWMVHADLIGGLAAYIAGVPNIVWGVRTTDYNIESRKTRLIRRLCIIASYLIPTSIICAASSSLKNSSDAGYNKKLLSVIHNGFDYDGLQRAVGTGKQFREALGIKKGDLLVGNIGRFNTAKDHRNFIQASLLVSAEFPSAKFILIGRDISTNNSAIDLEIRETNLKEKFFLLDERDDIPTCIDALDLFVLSSRSEGFPNVLGEAMAMGVPCVTTDVGDAKIIIGPGGRVVRPQDHEALSGAMLEVLKLPQDSRKDYGKRLSLRIQKEFSLTKIKNQYVQHYLSLMQVTDLER